MNSPTELVHAALAEVIELTGKPIMATSLNSALLAEALLSRECEVAGTRRAPFELDPADLKVEVFTPLVPMNRDVPRTWPQIRATHLPTGITVSGRGVSLLQAKAGVLTELTQRVKAHQDAAE